MLQSNLRDDRDYKKRKLSESTNGRGVSVAATGSPGTLIHTALSSPAANEWDAIHLYAVNNSGSAVLLTVQWGDTNSSDSIEVSMPADSGLVEIVPGLVLNNGAEVRAFAGTTNVVIVHGYIDRYEQEGR